MKRKKIVHLLDPDKFSIPFIRFIIKEFDSSEHFFLCALKPTREILQMSDHITFLHSPYRLHFFKNLAVFKASIRKADKIILHGNPLLYFFIFFPSAIKKIYWMILGYELGDSSIPEENTKSNSLSSRIKDFVLKRVKAHISHIKGDSDLANIQQHSTAVFFYSPMYLSNVVQEYKSENVTHSKKAQKKILVGNSACPTNDHVSVFEMLLPYKQENILIYCPLSYGNYEEYKNEIIKKGEELFGNKFIPLTQFMKFEDYNKFISEIDIAIFNHKRQEAMGVTLALLNMKKVVYMNTQTTAFKSLNERGIKVFDNKLIKMEGLFVPRNVSANPSRIYRDYSYCKLKSSFEIIFNS